MRSVKKHAIILFASLIIAFLLLPLTCEILGPQIKNLGASAGLIWRVKVDEKGIPVVDYGDLGEHRNPVTVANYALKYYEEYKLGNENAKQLFLNCAEFLANNLVDKGNYSVWEYNFPLSIYNLTPPWRSAMAQGLGIQVLAYAYTITGEKGYLEKAKKALNAFFVKVQDGGVTIKENEGWWYEEYADENGKTSRVLNGMIFALFGLYEYYKITGDVDAKLLFDKGVLSVKNHLHEYDANCWTYYDTLGNLASIDYHKIHVAQMLDLYNITRDEFFKNYYEKWSGYYNSFENRLIKFVKFPSRLEIGVFIVNFILSAAVFEIIAFALQMSNKSHNK